MTLLQYHLLGLAVTSATMVGFGLFLLFNKPKTILKRSMAFYCFSVAWWSGWECGSLLMPTKELSFLFMRVEYLGVVFIPTLLCTTVAYLLHFTPQMRKRFLAPLYIGSIAAIVPFTLFPTKQLLWVSSGPVFYLPVWGVAGPYYGIFMVFFFGAILTAHAFLFHYWRQAKEAERVRLALFLVGSALSYVGGCPEFGLKYGFRLGWLNPFGLYAFPLYIGILTYAVVQHQFFDIHIVVRKSLIYSILITLLTAGYFGLVYAVERIFQTTFGYNSIGFSLIAFALMTLAFQPLKGLIQRLVDRLVFRAPQEQIARRMERLEEHALQAEKFKAVSTLAAGMAHEIKNPLTALKTFTEFIPERQNDPAFLGKLHETFRAEVSRIEEIVRDVLEFSKPKIPQPKPLDLGRLVNSTLDLLSNTLLKQRIQWAVDFQHNGATLNADSGQLRQVLINLIQNAADAMPEGGELKIATQSVNNHLELTLSDTGHGIPPALLPKIFDPFVSTKPDGNGLGLAVVYSIIQAHHGTIRAESRRPADGSVAGGTTFTVRLPL